MTSSEAIAFHQKVLTPFEISEMLQQDNIYTIGNHRVHQESDVRDEDGSYNCQIGE